MAQYLTIKQDQQQNPLKMCGLVQSEQVFDDSSLYLLSQDLDVLIGSNSERGLVSSLENVTEYSMPLENLLLMREKLQHVSVHLLISLHSSFLD